MTAGDILANGCNLDVKNPHSEEKLEHLTPEELVESILDNERHIAEITAEIRQTLMRSDS